MRRTINNRGMTLIELILAMGLVSIIILAAGSVMLLGVKTYNAGVDNNVEQQSARVAMIYLSKDVRNAPLNSVSAPDTTLLVLNTELTVNGKVYTVSGGNLLCDGKLLANNVASFTVKYIEARKIQVEMTTSNQDVLSTQFYIR